MKFVGPQTVHRCTVHAKLVKSCGYCSLNSNRNNPKRVKTKTKKKKKRNKTQLQTQRSFKWKPNIHYITKCPYFKLNFPKIELYEIKLKKKKIHSQKKNFKKK